MRLYQLTGLRWLLRKSGALNVLGLKRMEHILPDIGPQSTWKSYYPAHGKETGRVALFTGCIGSVLDRDAIDACIKLLRLCGYGVHVPASQSCCGALHRHGGMTEQANELARCNLDAFNALDISVVLYTASGCGATLTEYPQYDSRDRFNMPVMDICQFLCGIDWPPEIIFKRLDADVLVHDPCSLRHVLHQQQGPYTLLRKISGLTVTPLADNGRCCGAAGSYMLSQPEMADSLRDDKVREIARLKPGFLVTSNIGCALHLMAGLGSQYPDIEVLHPATLLARRITTDT
jgi:glycolate oxidase iron-sulfur subunit